MFAVVVPADFEGRLVWSLTAYGETIAIPGHLRPEWEIDALEEVTSGNRPPVVRFGSPDGEPGQGQLGVRSGSAVRAVVSEPTPITVWATDDGVRKARNAARPTRFGLVWSQYRGPGAVAFEAHRAGGGRRREGGDHGDVRHAGTLRPAGARVGRLGGAGRDHGRRLLLLLDERLPDGRRRSAGIGAVERRGAPVRVGWKPGGAARRRWAGRGPAPWNGGFRRNARAVGGPAGGGAGRKRRRRSQSGTIVGTRCAARRRAAADGGRMETDREMPGERR